MSTLPLRFAKYRNVVLVSHRHFSASLSPQTSHVFENHFRLLRFSEVGLLVRVSSTFADSDFNQRRVAAVCKQNPCQINPALFRNSSLLLDNSNGTNIRRFASQPEPQRKVLEAQDNNAESITSQVSLTLPQKLVRGCPQRLQPYLKLSRIDRPIGTWLLFWPSTWGLTVASGGLPDLTILALFGAGAFVMRGAGCTVNDMWDRHIDPLVRRTSERPLASRQLRMRHAAAWLGGQLCIAFGILLQLNPSCFLISCGALGLVCLYPLAKRVTHWPQAVLGLTFNTGILIGFAAALPTKTGFFEVPYLDPACLSLYFSGILWTLIYDTIYAHQDLQDDTLLGLGSTARRFGDKTKLWLSGFSCMMMSSLVMAGTYADLSWPYYLGISGVAGHLFWQIYTLDIKNAPNCGARFSSNRHIGWLIGMSLLASYWVKNAEKESPMHRLKSKLSDSKDSLPVTNYASFAKSSV